jgi:hypothetical protein
VGNGRATAALVVGKLCSSKRQQNALTSAIKEYGALRRTVYAAFLWNLICQVLPGYGGPALLHRDGPLPGVRQELARPRPDPALRLPGVADAGSCRAKLSPAPRYQRQLSMG